MSLKPLLKSHKALNVEVSLLEALLYRGKNQYRSFPFWQKVNEVKRCSSRVADDIELLLGRLSKNETTSGQVKSSRSMILSMERVQLATNKAYFSLRQIIQLESFMPLVLSLAAIVAKISSIAEELLAHVALAAGMIDGLSAKTSKKRRVSAVESRQSEKTSVRPASPNIAAPDTSTLARERPKSSVATVQVDPQPEPVHQKVGLIASDLIEQEVKQPNTVVQSSTGSADQEIKHIIKERRKKRKKDEIDDIFGNL